MKKLLDICKILLLPFACLKMLWNYTRYICEFVGEWAWETSVKSYYKWRNEIEAANPYDYFAPPRRPNRQENNQ